MRYQEVQLGADSSWSVDEYSISAKLERFITASNAAEYVIEELQKHLDEAHSWNPPTFDDLERLAARLRRLADYAADQDWSADDRWAVRDSMLAPPELVSVVWTAAQVAATSIALGAAITNVGRKWRERSLPRGSRLTLTITPAKNDDQRKPVKIVIYDMNTKSTKEITAEIHDILNEYTRGSGESKTRLHLFNRGRHRS